MSGFNIAASNIAWKESDDQDVLGFMESLGFEGLEIAPTRVLGTDPYGQIDKARAFRDAVKSTYGLEICSMQSLWYGQTDNIYNDAERAQLLDYTKKAIEFASAIQCKNLVFGCPKQRTVPEGRNLHDADEFFVRTGASAAENDVVLALEANPPIYGTNLMNTTADAWDFLMSLPSQDGLSINLDMGTMIENGESVESVRPFIPFVSHVHISEPHLAPVKKRSEHIALRDMLKEEGYSGFISLEMAQSDLGVLKECLEYLAKVFS